MFHSNLHTLFYTPTKCRFIFRKRHFVRLTVYCFLVIIWSEIQPNHCRRKNWPGVHLLPRRRFQKSQMQFLHLLMSMELWLNHAYPYYTQAGLQHWIQYMYVFASISVGRKWTIISYNGFDNLRVCNVDIPVTWLGIIADSIDSVAVFDAFFLFFTGFFLLFFGLFRGFSFLLCGSIFLALWFQQSDPYFLNRRLWEINMPIVPANLSVSFLK